MSLRPRELETEIENERYLTFFKKGDLGFVAADCGYEPGDLYLQRAG